MNEIDAKMDYVEKMFVKYDATPIDSGEDKAVSEFGLRKSFFRNNLYYRVESASFEEGEVIIISATDQIKFAKAGLEDNIAAFPPSYTESKIEKEVRFAFGIEPYPETYPLYD